MDNRKQPAYMRGRTENERIMLWASEQNLTNDQLANIHVPSWVLRGEPPPSFGWR